PPISPPSFPTRRSSDLKMQLHDEFIAGPDRCSNTRSTRGFPDWTVPRWKARLTFWASAAGPAVVMGPGFGKSGRDLGESRDAAPDRKSTRLDSSHVKIR